MNTCGAASLGQTLGRLAALFSAGELTTCTSYWCTFSTNFEEWRDELASLQLDLITHSSSNIS